FFVTLPTFSLLGVPEPFGTPAAFSSRIEAGGVLVMKVYDRSAYTVITTGMMRPFCDAVFALKFLQKSMMLTPCWPRAGPTGGAGAALPRRDLQLDVAGDLLGHASSSSLTASGPAGTRARRASNVRRS